MSLLLVVLSLCPTLATAQSDSSSSNASNYGGGAALSINPRTGGVSLSVQLFELHGIVEEISATLLLTYRSEDAISDFESNATVFGLPFGWSLNLSYLENKNTYVELNVDGSQTYVYDESWKTQFTPKGQATPVIVQTGLKQYNKADANFRTDNGSVTVGGVSSAFVFATQDGMSRYLSNAGLLLQQSDRFGNSIQYFYNANVNPVQARLAKIVDSWGNEITLDYTGGQVTVTLPDGRTVGWVVENQLTKVIDALGNVTHLHWTTACGSYPVLSGVTSPSGGATSIDHQCMSVCTASTFPQSCAAPKQWPVAAVRYDCPNDPSGASCPAGSTDKHITTRYDIGGTPNSKTQFNYTGYPFYSPYDANDPSADALMESNNNSFMYTAVETKLDTDGVPRLETVSNYNFLHLEVDTVTSVRDPETGALVKSKETSSCYNLPGADNPGCPMSGPINYTELPANYQEPSITGTCVYAVGGVPQSGARLSITTKAYDSFGNVTNRRNYHGTTQSGVVASCDRQTRLDPSPLMLVLDNYLEHDTPETIENGYLELGAGAGHYGLMTAAQSFAYLDEDESGLNSVGLFAQSSGPVQVRLTCRQLTTDSDTVGAGAAVKVETFGSLSNSASAPTVAGVVSACASPAWDSSVAPPKVGTFGYDGHGRVVSMVQEWGEGGESQPGISSTQTTFSYDSSTQSTTDEQACPRVLEKTTTDAKGNRTVNRVCTTSGFPLSRSDAEGRTVFYEHDALGLLTKTTNPNGSFTTEEYFYACPVAQDGATQTCPTSGSRSCPYGDQDPPRSCTVQTLHAGDQNESYADGVLSVTVKDGMGRTVETLDNRGGSSGGYTEIQTRSTRTYDDLGLMTNETAQIGVSSPLIYETETSYGPKLRPILTCGPRKVAHEFIHDDIGQHFKKIMNGNQESRVSFNDSHKVTAILDCPVVGENTASGASCPTVAADTSSADCSGNSYEVHILRDGVGTQHSLTATDPNAAAAGASIESVTGQTVYSAELMKYGYSMLSTATQTGQQVTGDTNWQRDLLGHGLENTLKLTSPSSQDSFSSSTATFNEIGNQPSEINALGSLLTEQFSYTPTNKLAARTDYKGSAFNRYYDDMDWLVRHCYPSESGDGSEGEITERDAITGKLLEVTHFTNPGACVSCEGGDCGDVLGNSVAFSHTPFGAIESKTYTELETDGSTATTRLEWAYDEYQRLTCFADAAATMAGSSCPPSPTPSGWAPAPDELLTWVVYWPDSDTYRRGMPMSMCRGVVVGTTSEGTPTFSTRCVDTDYYTSVDTDGSCDDLAPKGAFAGLTKNTSLCSGGSCLGGGGSLIYQTTYEYDGHRRACSILSENASQSLILGASHTYDQYGNVTRMSHESELDHSTASNHQMAYQYDGMMRLVSSKRSDLDGNPLEWISYEYDAASNIKKKVEQLFEAQDDVLLTSTRGRASRVGTGKAGRLVVAGTVQLPRAFDLTQLSLEVVDLLREGDRELVTAGDGQPLLPLTVVERKVATPNKAVFLLTDGETKLRVKVKRKKDAVKVKVKARRVMVLESAACTDDPQGTTELSTRFELRDGNGDPVVVSHTGTWNCKKQGKKLKAAKG